MSMQSFRHSDGGAIDRALPLQFTFDGKRYQGYAGDTLASALMANGVRLFGRSFKYHRPRGLMGAGFEDPNALVQLRAGDRTEPNMQANRVELYDGLVAESQNRWPSLSFDLGSLTGLVGKLFPAGFYYKTFMWPKSFWDRVYEPMIRAAAGLGVSPNEEDTDRYASRYLHCDVLIVGAGPAGLAAALSAARSGAEIVLVDEQSEIGGTLLTEDKIEIDGSSAWNWLKAVRAELDKLENVRVMTRTTAIGYYHQNMVGLCQKVTDHLTSPPEHTPRERLWRVRAGQVVLAQGAIEKPLVFDGNDRPGVMLAGAAQTYLNRYGVRVGDQAVIATSHDSAWYAAFDLANAGVRVGAIVDTRADVDRSLMQQARDCGIDCMTSHTVTGTTGRRRVQSVRVNPVAGDTIGHASRLVCDTLLMCGGWTPSLHLFSHTKGSLEWDANAQVFLPGEKSEACHIAGAGRGLWGIANAFADGAKAGTDAANAAGVNVQPRGFMCRKDRPGRGVPHKELPTDRNPGKVRAFIDFQNDVTAKDIRLAVREGMRSIEHVKRYTTTGMATDQGKMANMNSLMIASDAVGKEAPEVGLTTFRPPYTPTTFGAFAGYQNGVHFEVTRKTPIDDWAEEQGAAFELVSNWRRAWYFPQAGEDRHRAVARECQATRQSVGIFDASTLGKIEIVGPDALIFLNRVYTNALDTLAVGRCRYCLLLGEDGYIRDDGIVSRIGPDAYNVTTTTGGAASVLNMMEDYLQTEWPDLNVWLTSTTEQWATIALNGPNAGKLLAPLIDDADISNRAFPHMSVTSCTIARIPTRLCRVSFTGELGYEISTPARYGRELWEILWDKGQRHDICPYGTETMHVLRAEKGYIIVGQDTDGTITPTDAGMEWAIGKKKSDFIGKRSLSRPDIVADGRKQLVGLLTDDPRIVLDEGAQIVADPTQSIPMEMIGHVTSAYWSEVLGRSIALAVVQAGHDRMGDTLHIPMPGSTISVRVSDTTFFDPNRNRLKV